MRLKFKKKVNVIQLNQELKNAGLDVKSITRLSNDSLIIDSDKSSKEILLKHIPSPEATPQLRYKTLREDIKNSSLTDELKKLLIRIIG